MEDKDKDKEISQISFFLAKPNNDFDSVVASKDLFAKKDEFSSHDFEVDGTECRFLYFESKSQKNNPKWLDFVNTQISENKPSFSNLSRSPNGILLTKIQGGIFLTTFGRASLSLIAKANLENDFGIRTAMNMCGNEEIRQTKSQSNTITTTQIDRQVSRPSDSLVFGLNEAEDLKYISAHMKGNANITLQGKDRLTLKITGTEKLTWDNITLKCQEFLEAYSKDDFKALFPNYKNFTPATVKQVEELDQKLIDTLKAKTIEKMQLCIPEFISDDEFCFTYTNKRKQQNDIYPHLDILQIFDYLKEDQLSGKYLRNKDIYAYSLEEDKVLPYKKWSIYNCLIFEAQLEEEYFILTDGVWSRVEDEFYNSIIDFMNEKVQVVDSINNCENIPINDDKDKRNKEEIFNNEVCKLNPNWVKFDRAKLRIGAGRKDKEFCDILAIIKDGLADIIHCKPFKDSSSLNYLFSQAKFYGDAFLQDKVFLKHIRDHITTSECSDKAIYLDHIKEEIEEIRGENYRVQLWLLYDNKKKVPTINDIPLIAQYEMMLMHDHLRRVCKFRDILVSFIPVVRVNYKTRKEPKAN